MQPWQTEAPTSAIRVHDALRAAILEGELAPGERLRAEALAERFGTSRARRSARRCSCSSARGSSSVEPHRGAIVRSFDAADLLDLYEVRALIEPHAAARAATRIEPEQLERMRALCVEGASGAPPRSPTRSPTTRSSTASSSRPRRSAAARRRRCARWPASRASSGPRSGPATSSARSRCSATASSCRALDAGQPELAEAVMRMHILGARDFLVAACIHALSRSPACAWSSSASCSPGPTSARCWATSAPTWSRSRRRRTATRCATGAACATTTTRCGGRSSPATSARSRSTCAPSAARRSPRELCGDAPTSCVENFRPGTMEKWGLGPEDVHAAQPARDLRARVRLRPDRPLPRPPGLRLAPARRSPACAHQRLPRPGAAAQRHLASATRWPPSPPSRGSCSRSTRATRAARRARWSTPRSPTPASRCSSRRSSSTRRPASCASRPARGCRASRRPTSTAARTASGW